MKLKMALATGFCLLMLTACSTEYDRQMEQGETQSITVDELINFVSSEGWLARAVVVTASLNHQMAATILTVALEHPSISDTEKKIAETYWSKMKPEKIRSN